MLMAREWFKRNKATTDQPKPASPAETPAKPRVTAGVAVEAGGATAVAPAGAARPTTSVRVEIPREKIAARAYEIWDRNGRPEGTAERDWLQAEAELRTEVATAPPAGATPRKPR